MNPTRTPLADQDNKLDIIEHVNDDHAPEVLTIAHAYGAPGAASARLDDIFEEGCTLDVRHPDGRSQTLFVPFALQGDLEENVLYLAYEAMTRQGLPLGGMKKQYFTVTGSERASPHMLRLHLQSAVPLPENAPGHAWFFALKTLSALPSKPPAQQERLSRPMQWLNLALLWWLKRASRQRREKVLLSFSKGQRYYTLRRAARSSPQAAFADMAQVDVYLHQDASGQPTPGSQWATGLKAGDVIASNAEYHEQTGHLAQGQCVLIGDETALPTVAAILENWHNPQPPVVFCITADEADQRYLSDALLPAGAALHRISACAQAGAAVIAALQHVPHIDAAWGALENDDAKAIRQWLRNARGLQGGQNRVKGYWRRGGAADAAH